MKARRTGAFVAALVLALAALLWWLAPSGGGGLGGSGGWLGGDDGEALAGGGSASADSGVGDGAGSPDGADAGAGLLTGPWLPFATVHADPSYPNGALSGRVISSGDGAPIAGADLVFLHGDVTLSATSAGDGGFVLPVPEAGRYQLSIATAEGFLPYAPELGHSAIAFEAHPDQRIDGVEVRLRPERRFEVQVVREGDVPVAGATVRLVGAGDGERAMAPVRSDYTTDGEGMAEVVAWGGALIEARHPELGLGRGRIGRRAQPGDRLKITLAAANDDETSNESIAGVVMDAERVPIEGAVVTAYRQARGLHPSAQAVTDPDGRFFLVGLDAGPHMLVTRHADHPNERTPSVQTGREDVEITLAPGNAIRGRVVDGEGEPVPAFHVVARRQRGALMRFNVRTTASYDADGRFELTGLPEGELELVATARGFPPSEPVSATPSASPPEVTLTLQRGGRLEGVVRDPDGAPIAGASVRLESSLGRGSSAAPVSPPSVSGEDGTFVLDGVGQDPRSVRVTAAGFHGRVLSGFTVPPGGTRRLDVELSPVAEGEESRTELTGIGVNVFPRGDAVVVGRVVDGGGAQTAGLQRGDRILAVDGVPVTALGFRGTLERIRGQEGTTVVLHIARGDAEPSDVPIVRTRVRT